MAGIRVLLWDVDNTLLDFNAAERAAIDAVFARFGLGTCSDEMAAAYSAINVRHWEMLERGELTKKQVLEDRFTEFFGRYGLHVDSIPELNDYYQTQLGETVVFMDQGDRIVRSLRGRVLQCAATNGTKEAQSRKLRNSGLDRLLDRVFISEDVGAEKPGAAYFDAVLREAEALLAERGDGEPLCRDQVMIVGDSLTSDMRGGNNAGILCCWYNPRGKENDRGVHIDYEIRDLHRVPEILRQQEEGRAVRKIYFAGSIRGGRVDAALYRRMIARMQERDVVLTEHVGGPELNVLERGAERDGEIYRQDTAWLRESDLLIAECTCPSLGVGYELAYAERYGKPCHIFYDRSRTQLSAMLTGNPYYRIHPYESEEELFRTLDEILG